MFKVGDKVIIRGNKDKVFTFISENKMFNYATVADDKFVYSVLMHTLQNYQDGAGNKQPSFSIKEGNIEKAARFIIANNKYMADKTVNYMTFSIKETIRRQIERIKNGEDAWYCSTAGYTVIIFQEDEDYYSVEVLVDPSVSSDAEFVNVEEII